VRWKGDWILRRDGGGQRIGSRWNRCERWWSVVYWSCLWRRDDGRIENWSWNWNWNWNWSGGGREIGGKGCRCGWKIGALSRRQGADREQGSRQLRS